MTGAINLANIEISIKVKGGRSNLKDVDDKKMSRKLSFDVVSYFLQFVCAKLFALKPALMLFWLAKNG
jgi:hypothetical protein